MRILGVDPALTVTGYGVIECRAKDVSLVEAGVVVTKSSTAIAQRLLQIHGAIAQIIAESLPEVVVLEKLFAHHRHPTTAFILGEARGVICLACAQAKVSLVEYPATRIKKAIVGKGLAGKYQVQRMVMHTLSIRELPHYSDVTDALALALAHHAISRVGAYR
jgi:crossover junction endodeoxyribonuclease RuvC